MGRSGRHVWASVSVLPLSCALPFLVTLVAVHAVYCPVTAELCVVGLSGAARALHGGTLLCTVLLQPGFPLDRILPNL